jgi:hypothetical protein
MTELILPAALYAETHFRFLGLSPSALFRREPEVVFDLPRRLVKGYDLPVILLINDIHQYPITIESVQITVSRIGDGNKPILHRFNICDIKNSEIEHPMKNIMGAYLLTVPRSELTNGEIFVNACLRYKRIKNGITGKHINIVLNDNLVTSTKYPFRCVITDEDFPGNDSCSFGDLHCHSQFSRSHVEWGPPVEAIGRIAAAGGLNFAAITDHSYDLACDPDNFLRQDRELRLWEYYKSSINNYNGETVLIPSEEVSVLNSENKVVHLCGLGISEYIPGTLDGARKSIHFNKQLTIEEAVDEIERQGGASFAAHAGAKGGILQRIFLRRGTWSVHDLCSKLGGIQAVNSGFFESWLRGKNLWLSMLQKGQRVPLLAGSDAHGDFNRYRAIAAPFLQIYENAERYLGFVRTGIYGKQTNAAEIIDGIRNAATFITNGPFATICDERNPEVSLVNSKSVTDYANLCVRASSTEEFGPLNVINVIMGRVGAAGETVIVRQALPPCTFDATIPIPADTLRGGCYLRTEAYGKTPRAETSIAATSACFIGD